MYWFEAPQGIGCGLEASGPNNDAQSGSQSRRMGRSLPTSQSDDQLESDLPTAHLEERVV